MGIPAFVDSLINMGEVFRQVNSPAFLLISLEQEMYILKHAHEKTSDY